MQNQMLYYIILDILIIKIFINLLERIFNPFYKIIVYLLHLNDMLYFILMQINLFNNI